MRFKRGKVWGLMCLNHKIMDFFVFVFVFSLEYNIIFLFISSSLR